MTTDRPRRRVGAPGHVARSLFGGDRTATRSGLLVGHHADRVTARVWALPLALLVLAASACGGSGYGDDHDRLLTTWERDDQGFPPADFGLSAGDVHCDTDSVLFLGMR